MNIISYVTIGLLILGYPLLGWLVVSRERRLVAEHERAFMEGTRLLAEQLAAVQIEVERAREVANEERDKRSRYFAQISVFEKQRNEWQELYHQQSIGHGNAQALMMQTIENLGRALAEKGVRFQIPNVLHAVREEYLSTHELPSREGQAALEKSRELPEGTVPQPTVVPDLPTAS